MEKKNSKVGVESLLRFGWLLIIIPVLFLIFLRYSGTRERLMSQHVDEHAVEVNISLKSISEGIDRQAEIIKETLKVVEDEGSALRLADVLISEMLSDFVANNDDACAYFYELDAGQRQTGWFAADIGFTVSGGALDHAAMAYGTEIDRGNGNSLYIGVVCELTLDIHNGKKILHIQTEDGMILDRSYQSTNLPIEQSANKLDLSSEYTALELNGDSYLLSHCRLTNGFILVEMQWLTFIYQWSFYAIGLIAAITLLLYILNYPFLEGGVSPLNKLGAYMNLNRRYAAVAVWVIILVPFAVQVATMWTMPNARIVMLIAPIGLVISLFLPRAHMTRRFLLGFFIAAQLVIFLEYIFIGYFSFTLPVLMSLGVMLLGYTLYCVVGSYVKTSVYSYDQLKTTSQQFSQSQALYLENEKMATLGRLISGIAHEINTPMGAIKACAENMETKLKPLVRGLLTIGQRQEILEEDIDELITLIDLCAKSVSEMRSTSEVRKAKKQIREFAKVMGFDEEIVRVLIKLELCDIEKLEKNIDIFSNPRIASIMRSLEYIYSFVSNLQNVAYASERITRIVFALKSYAHTGDKNHFLPFNIVRNIENVLVLYHNQTKHGIEVVRDFNENLPYAMGNQDELSQVWTNLIQNAIYAMSGVGKLTISIKKADGNKIEVEISDTGTGIDEENLSKIFESFFTTKPYGEGSGLGLDICKKIVEQHSGVITVRSTLGAGTTFTVSLPSDEREKETADAEPSQII